MRVLGGVAVFVDKVNEMSALCELFQKEMERMMVGTDESLHCIILRVVELSSGLLNISIRLAS